MTGSSLAPGGSLHGRLFAQARSVWHFLLSILLLDLMSTPLALLSPVPLKLAVDHVLGDEPVPSVVGRVIPGTVDSPNEVLVFAALLMVLVAVLSSLQGLASLLLRTYCGERLVLAFQRTLFRHAQRLSVLYHDRQGTTDAIYRIQYDSRAVQGIVVEGFIPLVTAAVTVVSMIWITAVLDWQLALVALAITPVLVLLAAYYRKHLRGQWSQVKKLESSALSVVYEVLTALRVVKAFGREEAEDVRFETHYREGFRARLGASTAEGRFNLMVGATTALGTALILFLGVQHVRAGILTLGSFLLVMSYLGQLYAPLKTMAAKATALQKAMVGAERAYALLDVPGDVVEHARPVRLARSSGSIAFRDVTFSYEADSPVLDGVTLEVPAGTRVGIAGPTGSGKTTLVSLLPRFLDPDSGLITLDGVDLRDYRLADLRSQFSIVLQDTVLFSTSIGENIAYARPEASTAEIEEAARAANIDRFVQGLPDGYDTTVGERGQRLSGGERQRVALARAFLRDAPILILDEPTSSVDVITEAGIMEAMSRLMEGRTTFMIAHRLSTLEHCDLVVTLEGGQLRLVDKGREPLYPIRRTV